MSECEATHIVRTIREQDHRPVPGFEDRYGNVVAAYRSHPVGTGWVFVPNVAGLDKDSSLAWSYPYYIVFSDGEYQQVAFADGLEAAEALLDVTGTQTP